MIIIISMFIKNIKKICLSTLFVSIFALKNINADSGFFSTGGKIVQIPSEKVIILNVNSKQEMIIQTDIYGSYNDFIWVIPVPSLPQVRILKDDIFKDIEKSFSMDINADPSDLSEEDEKNNNLKKATIIDIKIFSSFDKESDSFYLWLTRKGFIPNKILEKALIDFKQKNFYFIVIKLYTMDEIEKDRSFEWKIPPIHITFQSKNPFFPMKLHSQNSTNTKLNLYMIDTALIDDGTIFVPNFNKAKTPNKELNFKEFQYIYDIFPLTVKNKYFINKLEDIIYSGKNYEDVIIKSVFLNRNKYINILEDKDFTTTQRVQAIKTLAGDNNSDSLKIFYKLLKDDNDVLAIHSAIAIWKTNSDPLIPKILIEKFKKICQPYYFDCYIPESDKSFIEIFGELGLTDAIPILVKIINKARENILINQSGKGLPVYILRVLEAMEKIGTNKDAIPGLLYVTEQDPYFCYHSIVLATKLLGSVGDDNILSELNRISNLDWGGSSTEEAWKFYLIRDAAQEAILKIKLKKISDMEKKILFLRELMNNFNNVEESYQSSVELLRLGERGKSEEVFFNFLKMEDHIYGASQTANELLLYNAVPPLIESLILRKGNVPHTVYQALEKLDKDGISAPTLIKVIETNPNDIPITYSINTLKNIGTKETIDLLKASKLIGNEIKKEVIFHIEQRINN